MDLSMPPPGGRSGLIVPIPQAEPIVGELRGAHDTAAGLGVPAHVTVLFPFVPANAMNAELHAALTALFARIPAFGYRFERVARFDDSTVYLVPQPADAFLALTRSVVERWPQYPPYEGAFDEVIPHLTIGDQLAEGLADGVFDAAKAELERHGPVTGVAKAVELFAEDPTDHWLLRGEYPLAG